MPDIGTTALFMIALGITADNLMIAGVSGNAIGLSRTVFLTSKSRKANKRKWLFILLLLLIIQEQALLWGDWLGRVTQCFIQSSKRSAAIGILMGIGIRMLRELDLRQWRPNSLLLSGNVIVAYMLGPSLYVFSFGCCAHWLQKDDLTVRLCWLLAIISFLLIGFLLGRYNHIKVLPVIHIVATLMLLTGCMMIVIEYLIKQK